MSRSHYEHADALMGYVSSARPTGPISYEQVQVDVALAQVHATLALVDAIRESANPTIVIDGAKVTTKPGGYPMNTEGGLS